MFPAKFHQPNHKQQAQNLALKAEALARKLSGLLAPPADSAPNDIISVLNSTCSLLEDLVARGEVIHADVQSSTESVTPSPPEPVPERSLSARAKDLMKLRDSVLFAKAGDNAATPETLEAIYQQLGLILEKEGVTVLEETGEYDCDRQQVIDTRITDDPEKNNFVCSTVRPGYMFHGQLIRPQEVIVYTFETSDASTTMV